MLFIPHTAPLLAIVPADTTVHLALHESSLGAKGASRIATTRRRVRKMATVPRSCVGWVQLDLARLRSNETPQPDLSVQKVSMPGLAVQRSDIG